MKPVDQITDRAKRYRAQRQPIPGPKRCNFCARRKNIDVDHISGDESDGTADNLIYLCRACNTAKAVTQARNRIGIRTRQFNPYRPGRISFARFKQAARVLIGKEAGYATEATAVIRATSPADRVKFGDRIEAGNPFKSEAQRRKFFVMVARGEISRHELDEFAEHNPAGVPTFAQYAHGVSVHTRGAKDEGGAIIHATPPAVRSRYARQIARIKRTRGEIPF